MTDLLGWAAHWSSAAIPIVLLALWLGGSTSSRVASVAAALAAASAALAATAMPSLLQVLQSFVEPIDGRAANSFSPNMHAAILSAAAVATVLRRRSMAAVPLLVALAVFAWIKVTLGIDNESRMFAGAVIGGMAGICLETPRLLALVKRAAFVLTMVEYRLFGPR